MRRRPSGAPVLITTLLTSFACLTAHASAPLHVLASVTDYLTAFAGAYVPDPYDRALLVDAQYAARRAGLAMTPDVTFEQSLDWSAYNTLGLDLEAGLRLLLYDSRSRPSAALAAVDLEAAEVSLTAARASAELSFFVDLATYAALAESSDALAPVLGRLNEAPWLTDPRFDVTHIAPADRGLFEAHLRLLDMHVFLTEQLAEVVHRIARLLGLADDQLIAPSSAAVRAAVPPQQEAGTCLSAAPMVRAARLRHEQATLFAALEATMPVTLDLTSDLGVTLLGPGPTGGTALQWTPTASLALEARLGLSPGRLAWRDVDGTLTASATPHGASQSLRVSWPRPQQAIAVDSDPDSALADELHDVEVELRALRRAVSQAANERDRIRRALDWLLLDAFGSIPADPADPDDPDEVRTTSPTSRASAPDLRANALSPDTPPGLAAQVADLSAQLVFAELDETIASAQLAAACGAWP